MSLLLLLLPPIITLIWGSFYCEEEDDIRSNHDDHQWLQQRKPAAFESRASSRNNREIEYYLLDSSFERDNRYQSNEQVPFNRGTRIASQTSRQRDANRNLYHSPNSILNARAPQNQIPSSSRIYDTHHQYEVHGYQQNQSNLPASSSQRQDASNTHQSQQLTQVNSTMQHSNSSKSCLAIKGHSDRPTNPPSTLTLNVQEDALTKLKNKWKTKMQIDKFIQSKARNLPQSYRDFFNKVVKICHETIKNHLQPDWSKAVTRYTQMMKQQHENKAGFKPANSSKDKDRHSEMTVLMSHLEVYNMQKIGFDKAIISCFNEIVSEYKKGNRNKDISLDNNQAIRNIKDKIDLEIKRLRIRLPIYENRYQIQQQVEKNQVIVINGHTGCGKSTQIPQYVAELNVGKVICTQPTNIAAIGLANHLTQEYTRADLSIGCIVNHNRLHQKSRNNSIITFITDSILLDILVDDPTLSSYGCIIVNEAHQRSLYTDILLAFLKRALTRRRDLKVIIVSANVDTKVFSRYFNNCPTISVSSKLFPVDIKWCNNYVNNYLGKALDIVVDIHNRDEKGDILVFLVTPDETQNACVEIKKRLSNNPNSFIAISLHDSLQDTDLKKVSITDSSGRRKIIFATNCAETSFTIPKIRYVIDSGLVKERIYNNQSRCYSLSVHPICQSSAIQRCGRAGRIQSSICYRLYSQQVYDNMSQSSEPEIKRADLLNVILKMINLGVTDVVNFNFIESPSSQHIIDSLNTLHMLSALNKCTSPLNLTSDGRLFCKLPLEPRLSALIVNANKCNMLSEGIIVASALSISYNLSCHYGLERDKNNLNEFNTEFCYRDGDVISAAAVYVKWRSLRRTREYNSWCNKYKIYWEWIRLIDCKVRELEIFLNYLGIIKQRRLQIPSHLNSQSRNKLRQLLFQSYYDRLALFTGLEEIGYVTTSSDNQFLSHKSSAIFSLGSNHKFIVYQEILTTWDHFLINITPIDEEWLQSINDRDTNTKIKNMLDNVAITQTIDNLGSIVLSEYDTSTIDKMIKNLLQDENIRCNITRNVKGGNLQITTIKSKMPRVLDIINQSIMHKKEKLIKAIKILSNERENDACRLIIGRGIIVKDILLPDDSIEFKISLRYTGNDRTDEQNATEAINKVRALIMSCGELAIDIDSNSISKSSDYKYLQFDKIVYQEIRSQSLLKANDMNIISGYEINIENESLADCNITRGRILVQFRWPQRRRNGTVTVICRNRAAAINLQNDFPLLINNQTIYARVDRHDRHKLFLRQIPNSITANDIRMAVSFANRKAITEIYFHREATSVNDKISSSDLVSRLSSFLDKNGYFGKYSNVTIKSTTSIKKNPNIIADVIFNRHSDAVSAVYCLNDAVHEDLINEPMSVRLVYSRIIKCQQEIYTCVAKQIDHIRKSIVSIKDDQEEFVLINVHPSNNKYHSTSIVVKSWNELRLNEIVIRIGKIIDPAKVRIDVTEILDYLNTKNEGINLKSLSHRFGVHAKIDWKSQCIFIYGAKKAKNRAWRYCQKEINLLHSKCNIIKLAGNNRPKDIIKTIIKHYGINLNLLLQLSGADIVRLNRKNMTLIVIGNKQSIAYVSNQIDLCCNALGALAEKSSDPILANECVACFCEVDDDNYRLQYCGHLYCQECFRNQINSAIESWNFPLNCASCNQGFVIEDLEYFLIKSPQPRLFNVLLSEFVRRHTTLWHYCPTPGCESLYKRSDSYKVFTCPECQRKTCCKCDAKDHPGYHCDEIKLIRKNPDASIEKFLTKNSQNIKKCPKCNSAIEKTYGCHHMECCLCQTHFCWLCLAGYKTYEECYRHLHEKHENYTGE